MNQTSNLKNAAWLFAQPCEFLRGVVDVEGLPDTSHTEIAFAGRSNVGKSSLINALTGRKTLAKTSTTPGRTQELNFFLLAERLMIVDLPGYGFAKAPYAKVKLWTGLIKKYLRGRRQLARVFLLIDARHGIKAVDTQIMDMLDEAAVMYQVVLTKNDKIYPAEQKSVAEKTRAALKQRAAAYPEILATSSQTKEGIEALRDAIAAL